MNEEDAFYDFVCAKLDDKKYAKFIKKNGKPAQLPHEILAIGYTNFVPVLNTECQDANCVFDLSQVHDKYIATYDPSDAFRSEAGFNCPYCDQDIKYGNFFTSAQLSDDIELLFTNKYATKEKKKGVAFLDLNSLIAKENELKEPTKQKGKSALKSKGVIKLEPVPRGSQGSLKSALSKFAKVKGLKAKEKDAGDGNKSVKTSKLTIKSKKDSAKTKLSKAKGGK